MFNIFVFLSIQYLCLYLVLLLAQSTYISPAMKRQRERETVLVCNISFHFAQYYIFALHY